MSLSRRFNRWLEPRHPIANIQTLNRRRLYIFPTKFGWLFVLIVLTLLIGTINYQLNTGYILIFLLMIIGLMSMWQTHQNLQDLTIICQEIDDVEEGSPLKIKLTFEACATYFAIYFKFDEAEEQFIELINKENNSHTITLKTFRRGKFKLPTLKIYSVYPFGFFRVWSYLRFNQDYFVYPRGHETNFWPLPSANQFTHNKAYQIGDEELYELQSTALPWMQPSKVAWKVSAKNNLWYIKKTIDPLGVSLKFNIADIRASTIEIKLQCLAYLLKKAHTLQLSYALELGYYTSDFGNDYNHLKKLLRQLALYHV